MFPAIFDDFAVIVHAGESKERREAVARKEKIN